MNFYVVCLVFLQFICVISLKCVDEAGNEVDWYVLYKIPHIKKNPNELLRSGKAYLYISSSDITKWKLSNISLAEADSFLTHTLQPLYENKNKDKLMHILYNDEPPNKKGKSSKGHTKGIVVGAEDGGIWIVHSVPLYPPLVTERYEYPDSGLVYGQSVLCISMDATNLNEVGTQLQYNEIEMYSSNIPLNLTLHYPKLKDVINHVTIDDAPWYHTQVLKSRGGMEFTSFAKGRNFNKDLYEDWVAPTLQTNLYVETWLNGPGKLPSNCSKPISVKNVEEIKLDAAKVVFKSTLDHSKWAVNNDTKHSWVCIGDINRAEHQKHRGGGTVCLSNPKVGNEYRNAIAHIESCV